MLKIKEVVKAKGMTIESLANEMGTHRVNLSRIINGNPTVESLQKIADVLEVEVKELFKSEAKGQINGYVEFEGTIYKIESKKDVEELLNKM